MKFFYLLLALFLIKGIFLIFLIPPWESPEEPGHVSYVQYLVTNCAFPLSSPFMLTSINKSLINERRIMQRIQLKEGGQIEKQTLYDRESKKYDSGSTNVALNPPLYYMYLVPFYKASLLWTSYVTIVFLRFGSLLLGLGTIIAAYILAITLTKNQKTSLVVTFLVSMHPMFSFMSSVVSNDALVTFIFAVFLAATAMFITKKDNTPIDMILISLVSGLGLLVKPQLFILLPLFVLLLCLKKLKLSKIILVTVLTCVLPLIWYVYVFLREGSLVATYPLLAKSAEPVNIWMYPINFVLSGQPKGIFMTFWGFFGWLMVALPGWAYVGFALIIILSIVGWAKGWSGAKKKIKTIHIFLSVAFFLYVATIFTFDVWTYLLSHNFVVQGRYLLPILPILILFLVGGLANYSRTWTNRLVGAIIIFFVISQIALFSSIANYYYGSIIPPVFLFQIYDR